MTFYGIAPVYRVIIWRNRLFFVTLRQIINNDDMEKSIIGREKEKMELKKYISDIISKDGIDIDPLIEGY